MEFQPLLPEWLNDPYPFYARQRAAEPIFWSDTLSAYLMSTYADCAEVLKKSEDFAADPRRLNMPFPAVRMNLQTMDPPESGPLRKATAEAVHLGVGRMSAALGGLSEVASRELARVRRRDRPTDLVTEYSVPLCLRVICAALGVGQPDASWFAEVSERLVRGMDYGFRPEALQPSLLAREEISALTATWLDADAESVFLSSLFRAGSGYPTDVLVNTVRVVLHAGYSSVSRLLEHLLHLLLVRRDVFDKHRDRLTTAKAARAAAVEEVLRYDSPVQVSKRIAARDLVLSDVNVPHGATVIALIGAANRDPAVFDEPDSLVLQRSPNPHLSFGRGPHACLGANLSVELGSAVLEAFLTECPDASLADRPVRRDNASLRGFASLPAWLG